jgi:pimeloyl-ACP methyl ester carboxylesterase
MLCLHQTTRIGKDEPAGLGGRPTLHYAHELASRGYVCVAPDYPSFGDYPYDFRKASDRYASGSMKAIWNNLRALDLLETLEEVDPDRIGCIGHSLGAHNAIFTAVFDLRIRAVVSSCGFTAFFFHNGQKNMLDADIFIFHLGGFNKSGFQNGFCPGRQIGVAHIASADAGQFFKGSSDFAGNPSRRSSQFAEHDPSDSIGFLEHSRQQVLGFNLLVIITGCQVLGFLNQLLRFYGKFVKPHSLPLCKIWPEIC